jgi:aryl-alcohol dehydrogenase-like predicted oxidoreductase
LKYKNLGNSNLKVSEYCLGSMTWGEASSEKDGHWQLDSAKAHGINFVDTAEMYPTNPMRRETVGRTEEIIGSWIKNRKSRDSLIIATKITGSGSATVRNGEPINKSQLIKSVDESLVRLKTDYIDLYQLHWPNRGSYHFRKYWNFDPEIQSSKEMDEHVSEVLLTLSDLVRDGKIRSIGLSNESAWGTIKFLELARRNNLVKVVSIQNEYSLLCRLFDTDLSEVCHHENVQLLAFSPLAAGLLTGKYQNDIVPKGSRLDLTSTVTPNLSGRIGPNTFCAVEAYLNLAEKYNVDPVHMSLAFCASRPFMGSVIFGATNSKQLTHILKGLDLILSDEILAEINLVNRHNPMPI